MNIEIWPIEKIHPYENNPKFHNVEWIAKSIREFKIDQPIVVDGNGIIIKGHGRLKAAQSLGLKEFPVVVRTDLTPEQVRLARIADNRTNEGGWNNNLLSAELSNILGSMPEFDFAALGINNDWFSSLELPDLLGGQTDPTLDDEADDTIPDVEEEPITKLGDLWQVGSHRLLCGDSTSKENLNRLLTQDAVAMVFTDPPYGMNLDTNFSSITEQTRKKAKRTGKHNRLSETAASGRNYKRVIGDDKDFDPSFLFEFFPKVSEMFLWGADYYAERIPNKNKGSWYVWDKRAEGLEHVEFSLAEFETCWSKNKHSRKILRYQWFGACGLQFETDEFQKSKPLSRMHPNQKPVRMIKWFLEQFSKPQDVVVDLFGGSGSTLIACEKLNRQCLMMELDPHYCTVIIRRWERYTGQQAKRYDSI